MNYYHLLSVFFLLLPFWGTAQKVDLDSFGLTLNEQGKGKTDAENIALYLTYLKLAEEAQRQDLYGGIYYNLALYQQRQNNFEKCQEYIDRSIHWLKIHADTTNLARSYIMSGIMDFFKKDYAASAEKLELSATLYEATGNSLRAAFAKAKLGNVYEAQDLPEQATPYFAAFFEVAQSSGDSSMMMSALINLASNAFNLKQYEPALAYNQQSLEYAEALHRHHEYEQMLWLKSLIEEDKGSPEASIATLRKYVTFRDSFLNEEQNRQIAEMETQYETEKKEATIALQEVALQQQRTRFWLILGILAIALAGGALLFRLTRILRKRNEEKEFLIKEIHHRVKNNLQVLSSLLYLQSKHIKDDAALDAVREGQNRVDAMGLIHQKLYMGDNMAAVEMGDYLRNLGDTLLDSFGLDEDRIKINYHVEPLHLDVDTAIPLGLIINELVTNSLKYAFPDERPGTLEISLWKNKNGQLCLKVADDGVGKAGAPELKNSTSFGTNLVQILSKKLKGAPQVQDGEGYATVIEFENFKEVG